MAGISKAVTAWIVGTMAAPAGTAATAATAVSAATVAPAPATGKATSAVTWTWDGSMENFNMN